MKNRLIALALAVVTCLALSGCRFKYKGDHPDLYTVAVYNVFGACGYLSNGEAAYPPVIEVIETDSYGRVLFYYNESYNRPYGVAIVIMQRAEGGCVYYYTDICHTPYLGGADPYETEYGDLFTKAQVDALKQANDWNMPLNLDKCARSEIVERKNTEGGLGLKEKDFERVIKVYARSTGYRGDDNIYRISEFVNSDKYGREIYLVSGVGRDVKGEGVSPSSESRYFNLAMIFNPDKSCPEENVLPLADTGTTFEELMVFKSRCGWDTPWTENA